MLAGVLNSLARRVRRDGTDYRFDPRLGLWDSLGIILRVGGGIARGLRFRWRFERAGGLLLVGRGVRLSNLSHVSFQRNLVIEDLAELQGLAERGVHFGANVTIGRGAMIRPSGYYGRDMGVGLTVGDASNIGIGSYLGCSGGIRIGAHVMMGPYVRIFSENHVFDDPDVPMSSQGIVHGAVAVEDDCWLGAGATILAGVTVGRGSVVAAGAVVTKGVPPYSIVAGVPGRVVGRRRA